VSLKSQIFTSHASPVLTLPRRLLGRVLPFAALVLAFVTVRAADDARKNFSVPAGSAAQMLKQFATQAGSEIVFSPEVVSDVRTNAVSGELAPRAALDLMLADTGLVAAQEPKTGAFAVRRRTGDSEKNARARRRIAPRALTGRSWRWRPSR
jgi:hypothetical protein